jgi:DNA-binding MarR family transcriptional regulator
MPKKTSPRSLEVKDAAQINALLNIAERRYLTPFLARETTVGEAARWLGVKPNTMLKRVQRLLGLGLIRVTRSEPRGGRAIKRYTSVAERFFVPFHKSPTPTLEDALLEAVLEPNRLIARSLARTLSDRGQRVGYVFERIGDAVRFVTGWPEDEYFGALEANAPAFLRHGQVMRMPFSSAKAFQRELLALCERFDVGEGDRYLAFVSFAPLPLRRAD